MLNYEEAWGEAMELLARQGRITRERLVHDKHENKVPAPHATITLTDGQKCRVVCGKYSKGRGGWQILVQFDNGGVQMIGLRQITLADRKRERGQL